MKILIVEDDVMLGELLQEYLQRLEHERVRVCLTGREAFDVVTREAFDCAFVDLCLPDTDIDGLQLLTEIKEKTPPPGGNDERLYNPGLYDQGHAKKGL